MEKIKLICADLDGTLLNDAKTISDTGKAIIAQARAQGYVFSFCTGRSPYACTALIQSWHMEGLVDYVIGFNGSLIHDVQNDKLYERDMLEGKYLPDIFALLQGVDYTGLIFDGKTVHATKITPASQQLAQRNHLELIHDDLSGYYERPINKLLCIMNKDQLNSFLNDAPTYVMPSFKAVRSTPEYLEFMHPHLSKTNGIRTVCSLLGITLKQVLSFGDELNDWEMISDTIGVAMKNANPLLKPKARYITEFDNNHDGVARFIETHLLTHGR